MVWKKETNWNTACTQKYNGSDKTELDHLYPCICYECLNDFVTLDGSPSFLGVDDPGPPGMGFIKKPTQSVF